MLHTNKNSNGSYITLSLFVIVCVLIWFFKLTTTFNMVVLTTYFLKMITSPLFEPTVSVASTSSIFSNNFFGDSLRPVNWSGVVNQWADF